MICDFCSGPNPVLQYVSKPITILNPRGIWDGDDKWAACAACAPFIELRDWQALWKYMVNHWPDNPLRPKPLPDEGPSPTLLLVWDLFAANIIYKQPIVHMEM